MSYQYAVVGAGRQGTAAAYDLARFGNAEAVFMVDADADQANRAADRLEGLLGDRIAHPAVFDASDTDRLVAFLLEREIQAFISAVPYYYNLELTRAAIQAKACMTDLGGNSEIVLKQLEQTEAASEAGVTIVPDCGQVPGMGTTLILYAMEQLDEAWDVYMWDCGLPQDREPPWNYRLTFNIEGLTNEYAGDCLFIRDGKLVGIPALEELEQVEFAEPIGVLEGFTTSGGLTTAARSFAGKLRTLQNKTLRYPGHFDQLKVIQHLGLLETEPVEVSGERIVPRDVLHALWEPQIRADESTRDLVLTLIHAIGNKDGRETKAQVEFIHYYDEATGFTAMEQATGWHASILTAAILQGRVPKGVVPVERAMSGSDFVDEAARRGFNIRLEVSPQ